MPSFHTKAAFILLALGLTACGADAAVFSEPVVTTLPGGARHVHNPSTGLWDREPERRWRLVEEARIGQADGDGPDTFARVGGIIVPFPVRTHP